MRSEASGIATAETAVCRAAPTAMRESIFMTLFARVVANQKVQECDGWLNEYCEAIADVSATRLRGNKNRLFGWLGD